MPASRPAGGRSARSSWTESCASCAPSSGGRRRSMPWQPLLEGAARDSARESVRAILADLESWGREPSGDPSLAGGTAGLAVLLGYLAQTGQGPESAAVTRRCLQHATAA